MGMGVIMTVNVIVAVVVIVVVTGFVNGFGCIATPPRLGPVPRYSDRRLVV
jgi:uncharacterized membrane protein